MLSMKFAQYRRIGVTALMTGLVAVAACDDDPIDPTQGSNFGEVEVDVTTTGYEPDFVDYTVNLEGGGPVAVEPTGSATLYGAPAGQNTVVLNLPGNCTADANTKTVDVEAGETSDVSFTVTCEAITGGVLPAFTLGGEAADIDPQVSLLLDGEEVGTLDPSAPTVILNLEPGDYTATLGGVAPNCVVTEVEGVPVTVTAGQDASPAFTVTCEPNIGDLTITVTTTGTNLDDSYTLTIGDREPITVGPNDTVVLNDAPVGTVGARLSDIAANCTATGQAAGEDIERTAVVEFGAETPATIEFTVACE